MILSEEVKNNYTMQYKAPMAVVKGINHGSFSNEILLDTMKRQDIRPELPIKRAQRLIAKYINIFISYSVQVPGKNKKLERKLEQWYRRAEAFLQPIITMRLAEVDQNRESQWIKNAQIWLSGLGGQDTQFLKVKSYVTKKDIDIPPYLHIEYNHIPLVSVTTFLNIKRCNHGKTKDGILAQSPIQIKAYMLSPKRIQAHLRNATEVRKFTCKDLNYAAFVTALAMVPRRVLERYYAHHKGAVFHDDILVSSKSKWEKKRLNIRSTKHEQHVTAYVYQTDIESVNDEVEEGEAGGGLYYCTLLPPSRVMEWIYVDSLQSSYRNKVFQSCKQKNKMN